MPTSFVNVFKIVNEEDQAFLWVESLPRQKAVALGVRNEEGEVAKILLLYEMVPALAERLCDLVTREARVIIGTDDKYPDF